MGYPDHCGPKSLHQLSNYIIVWCCSINVPIILFPIYEKYMKILWLLLDIHFSICQKTQSNLGKFQGKLTARGHLLWMDPELTTGSKGCPWSLDTHPMVRTCMWPLVLASEFTHFHLNTMLSFFFVHCSFLNFWFEGDTCRD
jgi:hypothetical protein